MFRKRIITLLFLCLAWKGQAQNRYFTKTGKITFTAGTAMEDIDAVNKSVTSVFDISNGQIEFAVLIKGFEFRRGLMQEHFNENYLESEKYPKSIFKGRFDDATKIDFKKDGSYPALVKGTLEIHNIKKEVEISGTIKVSGEVIYSASEFKVQLADYGIKIPGAVKDKISSTVEIKVSCDYKML